MWSSSASQVLPSKQQRQHNSNLLKMKGWAALYLETCTTMLSLVVGIDVSHCAGAVGSQRPPQLPPLPHPHHHHPHPLPHPSSLDTGSWQPAPFNSSTWVWLITSAQHRPCPPHLPPHWWDCPNWDIMRNLCGVSCYFSKQLKVLWKVKWETRCQWLGWDSDMDGTAVV